MKRLIIVVNVDFFFLSHRKNLAVTAQKKGFDVTVITHDTGRISEISDLGLKVINLPLNRSGMNLRDEFKTFFFLFKQYRRINPDIVHHVGLKPVLWGSLAAKFAGIKGEVNALSGMGTLFIGENKSRITEGILKFLRFTFNRKNVATIFQNKEDLSMFKDEGVLKKSQNNIIEGSGVDLDVYKFTDEPISDRVRILFAGRMLKTKGVIELFRAAEILRDKCNDMAEFVFAGSVDDNPDALSQKEIEEKCDGKYIVWIGNRSDMIEQYKKCHVMCLPSYREGLPKAVIEAMAIGRPIVTTNAIGCKDTVDEGKNGYKVPVGDSKQLADSLYKLISDKELRIRMGKKSREFAENKYDLQMVINKHLEIYNSFEK